MTESRGVSGWGLRLGMGVIAGLAVGVIGLYVFVQSQTGLNFIASRMAQAFSDRSAIIRVAGVKGSVLSSFRVGTITVSDRSGIYATAHDLQVTWHPLALLKKTIHMDTLSVGKLAVARLPQSDVGSLPLASEDFATGFHIRAGKITVAEAALEKPVLGEPQSLSATAAVSLHGELRHAALDLSLRRLHGGEGMAEVKLDYAMYPARFDARIRIDEPAGSLLARLAGLPRHAPLRVDLRGEGPADDWRGILKLEAGSVLSVNSAVSLAVRDTALGVSMVGKAKPAGLMAPDLRALVTPPVRFRVDAEVIPARGLSIRRFTSESKFLTLSGTGRYGFGDRQLAAELTGSMRGASPIAAALFPGLSVQGMDFDAKLDGTPEAPRTSLSFQTGVASVGPVSMASTTGSIVLTPHSATAYALKAGIRADGVEPGSAFPPGILGNTIDGTLSGTLDRGGALSDFRITAASGLSRVDVTGRLDRDGLGVGSYSLRLAQIETLARSAGMELKGKFQAEGTFRAQVPETSVQATVTGSLDDLTGLPPRLVSLVGGNLPFEGAFVWSEGKPIRVTGLVMTTAIGRLEMNGQMDTGSGVLSANLQATVPDLKPLRDMAGFSLSGQASLSAALGGPMDGITARGQARVTGLRVSDGAVGDIGVDYDARLKGPVIHSQMRFSGDLFNKDLKGTLDARVGSNSVDLSAMDITLGKNQLAGRFGLDLIRLHPSGTLTASLHDMSDLPRVGELGLSGSGEIRAAPGPGSGNDWALTGTARNVHLKIGDMGGAAIGRVMANVRLKDPFVRTTADGRLKLENFTVAGLRRGNANIRISGDGSSIRWGTSLNAESIHPVSISAKGSASFSTGRSTLAIDALKGEFANQPITLAGPFRLTWQEGDWRVSPVDISLASGRFRMAGSKGSASVDLTGRFEDFPLQLVSLIEPRFQLSGTMAGELWVSGSPPSPILTASITASHIRPPDVSREEFAGFALAIDLRQDTASGIATARLTGPEETSATVSLKTPPVFTFSPVSLNLKSDLPVTGELTADGHLHLVDRLVGLGDDRLAGRVSATAKISGTFAAPEIQGEARLRDGTYEGAETGTVLRKIDAKINFSGDGARLVSLTANDGATGRLSGSGVVQFSGTDLSTPGVVVKLDRFVALRHPLAETVVSGNLSLSGSLKTPRLTGRLQIDKGDIGIPDQLPEQIIELDVTEINQRAANIDEAPRRKEPSLAKTFPVSLDIVVNIPNRTFVRGRGLESEWKGDLVISGTSDAPAVKGRLQAVRGTFAFTGKTFVVRSGSVFFPQSAAEPEIEAMADAKLKDLVARVEISGKISKPAITISSEPALPQEDVLAHILFGRTTGQLSAIQAAQLAQTAATLSGTGGSGIMDKVRQALGVDVLNVESTEGEGQGASLKAGKYLTEEVFLSVTQGTQPGSQKIGVEVQVLPNITVESDISGTADSNIGLNWKWDY